MIKLCLNNVMITHKAKEVQKSGRVYLAALGFEKFLELVVAQR